MITIKTKPIGEIFKYRNVKLLVVENATCEGCFFYNKEGCLNSMKITGYCSYFIRNDNKNVIFKRIDE